MKIIEMFSGTASFSSVFKEDGHEVLTIDNDPQFDADIQVDLNDITADQLYYLVNQAGFGNADVIWASPPCEVFSVPALGHNWAKIDGNFYPKRAAVDDGVRLVQMAVWLIVIVKPRYAFIENPRAILRKLGLLDGMDRTTVTYCQYGDTRQKPTDIWGLGLNRFHFRPMCKPGTICHDRAPRGSRRGTQGMKDRVSRGVIPSGLCMDLRNQIYRLERGDQHINSIRDLEEEKP